MIAQILGWAGSIGFATCCFPQVIQCVKQGHAHGISLSFLLLWLMGEVCCIPASIMEAGPIWWLLTNYVINLLCLLVILFYKLFPLDIWVPEGMVMCVRGVCQETNMDNSND